MLWCSGSGIPLLKGKGQLYLGSSQQDQNVRFNRRKGIVGQGKGEGAATPSSSLGSGLGFPTSCLAKDLPREVETDSIHPTGLILQPGRVGVVVPVSEAESKALGSHAPAHHVINA